VLLAGVEGPEEVRVGDHAHLGLRKDSLLRGIGHVARQGVPGPTPHALPVHGCDHGFREFPDLQEPGRLAV